ncbi:MAG TPA: FAD-binding and (Fe-S)-binding domain-containing protein [Chloroflexota bacterium]|nr:FAD-binding and (Fe-S)-binding domain-containing protein [Chloroflexota bacterium]
MNTVTTNGVSVQSRPHAGGRGSGAREVDAAGLAAALRCELRGEARFDAGSRALYAADASNYRQVPIGVVVPRDVDDVVATVATCRRFGAPLLSRGGGTSLAGQCCNVAVVLDFSKYLHQVLQIDPEQRIARVQPGTVLDTLRAAAERHHLTYGPDPATHNRCTLGGMIGNNSCGVHSVMAGMTSDNVEELEVLTYDGLRLRVGRTPDAVLTTIVAEGGRRGEIYGRLRALRDHYADAIHQRYPDIPRRVSGYNLPALLPENNFHVARALVGTEGTCVTVLEATVRLVHSPPARVMVVLGYPDVYTACDHVPAILEHHPVGLEGFDDILIHYMRRKGLHPDDLPLLPAGGGWLLVEFGAETRDEATAQAQGLIDALKGQEHAPDMKLYADPEQQAKLWEIRESGLGATAIVPGEPPAWPGWEDSAVPPARLGDYLRDLRQLIDRYDYTASFYGHFGQGCLHTRITFDFTTAAGIARYRGFMGEAADLVLRYGGSLSGEHGDGQARAELLPKMFGDELVGAFREFKAIWDPDGKMNPGKVVAPARMDEHLRLGTGYAPPAPRTHFAFRDDGGSFAHATLRCVGVGKCRKTDAGLMCPSYMVTREEEHSTRGRAHLLFEMLQGDPVRGGWRDEHVKQALDLCLACKGCKGECPVHVDMATYKAEFLSHYYAGRLRPRQAYAFGLIMYWARLAAPLAGLANFMTQTPLLRDAAKATAGMAPAREVPRFAPQTFQRWARQRERRNWGGPPVLLWPDTFNNHFHPSTAVAAVEVLEAAGYRVVVPQRALCCGRPLYDYGMLDLAKRFLRQILATLRQPIRAGVPIVVLEPSCFAVFRDELRNLFPHDEDARRLCEQAFLLDEFLQRRATGYEPPELHAKALVHGHCHHQAVVRMTDEEALFRRIGLDFQVLDAGCCGMAGAFGFEPGEHYRVSVAAGERVLLPAVRNAPKDTLIVADGFSCREQIRQGTDRAALHPAQVLQLALHGERGLTRQSYPEAQYADLRDAGDGKGTARAAAAAAALMIGGGLLAAARRR